MLDDETVEGKLTHAERLKSLRTLIRSQIDLDPNPVEILESLDGKITDYLLFWDDREQRALICAETGKITVYLYRREEYVGDDLREFNSEVDARIEEIENCDACG